MKQTFQENRNAFLLLLGLLFLLLFAIYFFFYRPLAEDLGQKERQEEMLVSDIAVLEEQISRSDLDDADTLDGIRYEPQIPNQQNLDEFILVLNEIELVSNSRINSISFGYSGSLPERVLPSEEEMAEGDGESENEERNLEEEMETELEGENTSDEVETSIQFIEKPVGLEPIQVTLNIESPDYEHFQLFLKEIENQERKMVVSSLNFDKPAEDELIFSEEPDETISATVNVMTFYYNN